MECPGLNGLWVACPPTIDGLTDTERAFFGFLGEPIVVTIVLVIVVVATILVLLASDGLPVGPIARTLPRRADVAGALRHARELRRNGAHRAYRHASARTAPARAGRPEASSPAPVGVGRGATEPPRRPLDRAA